MINDLTIFEVAAFFSLFVPVLFLCLGLLIWGDTLLDQHEKKRRPKK